MRPPAWQEFPFPMKKSHRTFAVVCLALGVSAAGCTLITEVDRSLIPKGGDGGAGTGGANGGEGGATGGTPGTGGSPGGAMNGGAGGMGGEG